MLIVFPYSFSEYMGAALSALIIVACMIGLTLSKEVYAGIPRRDYFCYFTNLSNLLVLFYFGMAAPQLYAYARLSHLIPIVEYCVTMCILLTHLVFHFVLLPHAHLYVQQAESIADARMMAVNTLFVHYIVPWLTLAYWIFCAPKKHTLPLYAALLWTLLPCIYAAAIFLRARFRGNIPGLKTPYPYPFMDAAKYGAMSVIRSCAGLWFACVLFSGALLLMIRFFLVLIG